MPTSVKKCGERCFTSGGWMGVNGVASGLVFSFFEPPSENVFSFTIVGQA